MVNITTNIPNSAAQASQSQAKARQNPAAALAAAARATLLDTPIRGNRARVEGGLSSYHVVPKSNIPTQGELAQRMGAGGDAMFRRITQRQGGKGGRR